MKQFMSKSYCLALFLAILYLPALTFAQTSVQTTIPQPNFLYQCGDSSSFTVKIKNTTALPITNIVVDITQPTGIVKVGSATAKKNNLNTAVTDIAANTNSTTPTFSFTTTVIMGDSIVLSYWAKALCNTANLSYTNTVKVTYTTGVTQVSTPAYTVQLPFLELDNAGSTSTNISCANDQFTQLVRVSNNGNFNSFMKFVDIEIIHPASVGIISTTIGTIMVVDGKTIVRLSGAHFSTIGNTDTGLDFDEQISLTITGRLLDCITTNQQVRFQPLYRCDASQVAVCRRVPETITHTLNVTTADTPPTLGVTTSCALNSPTSSLQITNNGASTSQFVRLNLTIPAGCDCQAIDFSTLTGSINGGANFPIIPTATTATGSACLAGNPNNVRALTVNLPNLNVTQVLTLNWNAPLCASAACNDASLYWQYELLYQSACCPNTIVNIGTGTCTIQPQLTANFNASCTNGTKSITITNTGNKVATDIAIKVLTNAGHLSGITAGSVSASSATLTFVGSLLANVCSNPALLREANYTLNTLAAGSSVTITWSIASCQNFQACTTYNSEDYGYQISYAQSCATGTLALNGNRATQESSLIIDLDTDLVRTRTCPTENTYTLPLRISGSSLTYSQRYAEVVINLPANVTWNGTVADLLLNGVTPPVSTMVLGNTMTIRYALPIAILPANITPTFNIACALACNGVQNIEYALNTYNDCNGDNALLHSCNDTQFLNIITPNPACLFPTGFGCVSPTVPTRTVRTSFGQDDGNDNRHEDADMSQQASRLNKLLMFTDTLQTSYTGVVASAPNSDTLIVNIVLYQRAGGSYNYLSLLDLDLNITDLSTGNVYALSNVYACAGIASIRDTLSSRIYTLALTEVAINNCYPGLLPAGFQFDAGDVVNYVMKHRVNSNLGLNVTRTLQVITDMYLINSPSLWEIPLPIFPGCPNLPADSVQVVGYRYDVTAQQTSADICRGAIDITITHDFNIRATGNLNVFPYEDRKWIKFKSIKITIPTGFICNPATSVWTYTTPPDVLTLPVPTTTQVGNVITFDLANYYTANNISVDDGNKLSIKLTLQTLCNAQASNTLVADYIYDTTLPLNSTTLPAQATFNISTNVPIITYNVNASPVLCTGTKATWSFSVASSAASGINPLSDYYNWLHIAVPPTSGFSNLVLKEGIATIMPDMVSGFYLLGNIPKGTTKTYSITVDYANSNGAACYNNVMKLFYDWSCDAINTNFTTANFKTGYACGYDSTQLSFSSSANTVLIDVLNTSYSKVNVCENNTYKARVRNIGQNDLRNVVITVTPPTGFSFIANSFIYTYLPTVNQPFTNGTLVLPLFAIDSTLDVSFQYTTTCLDNLLGNAQFIIKINVETCCAGDTLASYPLPALDVSQIGKGEHKFNVVLNNTPDLTCVIKETVFTINLTNTGIEASGSTDFVSVTIPSGLRYKPNTISTNLGAIGDTSLNVMGNKLYWKMDPTNLNPIPIGGTRQFTLTLMDTTAIVSCSNFNVIVETFQQGIVACNMLTPSLSCTTWRNTGRKNKRIRVQNTNFSIINFQQTSYASNSPTVLGNANITFRNNGPNVVLAGTIYNVKVYFDNVYNSTLSITIPLQISIGGTFVYAYNNISCGVCDVRIELEKATPNCVCLPSQDELWTGVPLNVITNITAYLNLKEQGIIYWTTESNNVLSFSLERSEGVSSFVTIATILPESNKTAYNYIDNTLQEGSYYYRLRTNWKQGSNTRSNVVQLKVSEKEETTLTLYPNPFEKDVHIKFSKTLVGELYIVIYDHAGRQVFIDDVEMNSNKHTISSLVLPKGSYTLHAQYKNKVWTKTIVK